MKTLRGHGAELTMGLACLLATAVAVPTAEAGTTTQLTNFGSNPNSLPMYLYTPSNVGAKPPILVHLHACHASNGGQSMCSSGNSFAQQADKYGFVMICPSAVSKDQCWDVHSTADLTHNGTGSDAEGIMSAVNYVIANKNGDANRVYVAGYSSGGMMTQAMIGAYPDVFKAGAAFAGVPFACFAQGNIDSLGWSSTCATGNVTKTGVQWGDLVRAAYPGYTGTRPRIQLWHGSLDTTVAFHTFAEAIKQWTNVLGVSETPTSTENNAIQTGWIRTRYVDSAGVVQVEAIQETGKGHGDLVVDPNAADAIRFLGLDGSNPVPDAGASKDSAVADTAFRDAFTRTDSPGNTGGTTGTGGVTETGGAGATGGAPATGGTGASGGTTSSGGAGATGGVLGTGGMAATGGVVASGGVSGTGGAIHTGGTNSIGGSMAAGGSAGGSATSGSSTTSQATPDAGTKPTADGASSGGSTGTPPSKGSSSGCSLTGGDSDLSAPARLLLVLAILIVVVSSGRKRNSQPLDTVHFSEDTHATPLPLHASCPSVAGPGAQLRRLGAGRLRSLPYRRHHGVRIREELRGHDS
jgi:poly(hydroxyalkanoate) depolymerase family esterase